MQNILVETDKCCGRNFCPFI